MDSKSQILPMPYVHGIWESKWDPYPTIVRVSMTDGKVVNYYRDPGDAAPVMKHALDHFNETCQVKKEGRRRAKRHYEEAGAAGVPDVAEDGPGQ